MGYAVDAVARSTKERFVSFFGWVGTPEIVSEAEGVALAIDDTPARGWVSVGVLVLDGKPRPETVSMLAVREHRVNAGIARMRPLFAALVARRLGGWRVGERTIKHPETGDTVVEWPEAKSGGMQRDALFGVFERISAKAQLATACQRISSVPVSVDGVSPAGYLSQTTRPALGEWLDDWVAQLHPVADEETRAAIAAAALAEIRDGAGVGRALEIASAKAERGEVIAPQSVQTLGQLLGTPRGDRARPTPVSDEQPATAPGPRPVPVLLPTAIAGCALVLAVGNTIGWW